MISFEGRPKNHLFGWNKAIVDFTINEKRVVTNEDVVFKFTHPFKTLIVPYIEVVNVIYEDGLPRYSQTVVFRPGDVEDLVAMMHGLSLTHRIMTIVNISEIEVFVTESPTLETNIDADGIAAMVDFLCRRKVDDR